MTLKKITQGSLAVGLAAGSLYLYSLGREYISEEQRALARALECPDLSDAGKIKSHREKMMEESFREQIREQIKENLEKMGIYYTNVENCVDTNQNKK